MKLSLSDAPSGCHLSPDKGLSSHLFDLSEESGISDASSTEKSMKGTDKALLVPLVERRGILLTLQLTDSNFVSTRAFDSASPGLPVAATDSLPGRGPVTDSLPNLQFLLHLSKLLLLTDAILETSILPFVFVGATISPISGSMMLRPDEILLESV